MRQELTLSVEGNQRDNKCLRYSHPQKRRSQEGEDRSGQATEQLGIPNSLTAGSALVKQQTENSALTCARHRRNSSPLVKLLYPPNTMILGRPLSRGGVRDSDWSK